MALNIKHAEVERLATEVGILANESKTEAIRKALVERAERLKMRGGAQNTDQRIADILVRVRTDFPNGDFGRKMSRARKEAILGYGPGGV